MPRRRYSARAIVLPVDTTLLAQASIVGEGLMGTNMFEPLAPEGEKFPGILETMEPDEFPHVLDANALAKQMFYRADLRPDIEVFIPKDFYDDGARHQLRKQKKAKGEVAFADSIGGAIYGAVQNRHHGDDIVPEDFLDDSVQYYLHLYSTDRMFDYTPESSQMDALMSCETDFCVTGEVRYLDDVPVRYLGKFPITKREIAILATLVYKGREVADFDFEIRGTPEDYENGIAHVVAGDKDFIKKHVLPWPGEEIPQNGEYAEGINTEIASMMVMYFNKKWDLIQSKRMKAKGLGRGWHYEHYRHSLAARGVRMR